MTISKDEFRRYVRVQKSGVVNMFAVDVVSDLSMLHREKIIYIMEHYSELAEKYPEVMKS